MSAKVKLWILILEAVGFVGVIAVIWLDELVDLPYYLFGTLHTPGRMPEAWLESLLVLIVCAGIVVSTIGLFNRIGRLESFIVMCAWCRKVKVDGRWITFEEYLSEKNSLQTSHGVCKACAEKQLRVVESQFAGEK